MPHCQVCGPTDLREFHLRFRPRTLRRGPMILKAEEAFLSTGGRSLLLECLVIEGYLRQAFFAVITREEEGAMVRLHPRTSPEKTEGVKRCLAWIALSLRASAPGTSLGRTNLQDQLGIEIPDGEILP